MPRPPLPPLPKRLAVVDPAHDRIPDDDAFRRICRALVAAGADGVQLRDRAVDDRRRFERIVVARAALPPEIALHVSRRVDLALAGGADGVQLPANGLPVAAARRLAGDRLRIGRSTHALDEVGRARDEGADFAIFGPVWATPSKEGILPPRGVEALAAAARVGLPVLAIGGVSPERLAALTTAGVHGFAAIRLFERATIANPPTSPPEAAT